MSSSPISRSAQEKSILYSSVGLASIEFRTSGDCIELVANADGLRSLARLFNQIAGRSDPTGHIHLTPTMQLTEDSVEFVVERREGGSLPDGTPAQPTGETEAAPE